MNHINNGAKNNFNNLKELFCITFFCFNVKFDIESTRKLTKIKILGFASNNLSLEKITQNNTKKNNAVRTNTRSNLS